MWTERIRKIRLHTTLRHVDHVKTTVSDFSFLILRKRQAHLTSHLGRSESRSFLLTPIRIRMSSFTYYSETRKGR